MVTAHGFRAIYQLPTISRIISSLIKFLITNCGYGISALLWFVILIIALIIRCTNCNLPISLLRMYIISLIITYTKKGDALQFSILHCATAHFAVFRVACLRYNSRITASAFIHIFSADNGIWYMIYLFYIRAFHTLRVLIYRNL
jgi:hypothetical protein